MNFVSVEIALAVIAPALILAGYVLWRDKVEREPIWLVALLLVAGAVIYVPAYFAETGMSEAIAALFSDHVKYHFNGTAVYSSTAVKYGYGLTVVFVGVALIEEVFKWLAMFLVTRKNKNFNCLYDGIVYGVLVSLGFAVAENVFYAWQSGWDTLLIRVLYTLPGHIYFGVLMGYCYTMWSVYKSASLAEKEYEKKGLIKVAKPIKTKGRFALMILLPLLEHGVYGCAEFFSSTATNYIFFAVNAMLFALCMAGVTKLSGEDTYRGRFADALLDKKYPEIKDVCDDVEEDMGVFMESGVEEDGK